MKIAIMMVEFVLEAQGYLKSSPRGDCPCRKAEGPPFHRTMRVSALSALPIAVGGGPGYGFRRPIGITLVGGLIAAQLVMLDAQPVMSSLLEPLRRRLSTVRQNAAWPRERLPRLTAYVGFDEHECEQCCRIDRGQM
jgi:multidrug efflux pump